MSDLRKLIMSTQITQYKEDSFILWSFTLISAHVILVKLQRKLHYKICTQPQLISVLPVSCAHDDTF